MQASYQTLDKLLKPFEIRWAGAVYRFKSGCIQYRFLLARLLQLRVSLLLAFLFDSGSRFVYQE